MIKITDLRLGNNVGVTYPYGVGEITSLYGSNKAIRKLACEVWV